jgi:hypothetical protein
MGVSGGLSRNLSRSSLQLMLIRWLMKSPVRTDNQSQDRLLQSSEPRLNYAQIIEKVTANLQNLACEVWAKRDPVASL